MYGPMFPILMVVSLIPCRLSAPAGAAPRASVSTASPRITRKRARVFMFTSNRLLGSVGRVSARPCGGGRSPWPVTSRRARASGAPGCRPRPRRRRPAWAGARPRSPGSGRRSGACPSRARPAARVSRTRAAASWIAGGQRRSISARRSAEVERRRRAAPASPRGAARSPPRPPGRPTSATPYASRARADAEEPRAHVVAHALGVPPARVAVAAAAGREDAHDVAGLEVEHVDLADVARPRRVAVDHAAPRGAGAAAGHAPRLQA